MVIGVENHTPSWLNPDVLTDFMDELREAGYRIGISQYIAAQDLILALTTQGVLLGHPERLKTLLGPIVCSSPSEQEDFGYRFQQWVERFQKNGQVISPEDTKAVELSEELGKLRWRLRQLILTVVGITLTGVFLPVVVELINRNDKPITPTTPSPTTPITPSPITSTTPSTTPITSPTVSITPLQTAPATPTPTPSGSDNSSDNNGDRLQDWQIDIGFTFLAVLIAFLVWHLWWLWRAQLFLERHSTTQQPELQKISIGGFEQTLFPSVAFIQAAQNLRKRIAVSSNQLDIHKTIDATLRRGGLSTPVYGFRQVMPEYLALIDRTSYRDHQAKFVEELVNRLIQNGVFMTVYYFDDDPQVCFPADGISSPQKLREVAIRYSEYRLILLADVERLFDPATGELKPWVDQTSTWSKRAILTPKSLETWGFQEFTLMQQFIVLTATPEGIQTLGQVFSQGTATFQPAEGNPVLLPETLRVRPQRWIERDPPSVEQVDAVLKALQKFLGSDGFYWLCACAVFPEMHWNITLYLGRMLKSTSRHSLLETCPVIHLARLPWFRYGYMPDWLRDRLINTITPIQEKAIRTALQDLLITAVQGSIGELQLQVARQHHNFLPNLANPLLRLLSAKAPKESPLRDYTFLSFMTGQPKLAVAVPHEFNRLLRERKTRRWLTVLGTAVAALFALSLGIHYYPQWFPGSISRSTPKLPGTRSTSSAASPNGLLRTMNVSGQNSIVRTVNISPDGKTIVSGDDEGKAQLWNLNTGQLLRGLRRSSGNVQAVVFSPDGKTIAVGGAGNIIELWDLNGSQTFQINSTSAIYSLAFSPDGKVLLSGQRGGVIKVWNIGGSKEPRSSINAYPSNANVTEIAISPDSASFATRGFESINSQNDSEIKVWSLQNGQQIRSFNAGGSGGINSIAISPDGRLLAAYASKDETVKIWNFATGELLSTLNVEFKRPHAISFSPDGRTLAVGGFADKIQLWDTSTYTKIRELSAGTAYQTYSLTFSPDGQTIVTSGINGSGGVVMVWDVSKS